MPPTQSLSAEPGTAHSGWYSRLWCHDGRCSDSEGTTRQRPTETTENTHSDCEVMIWQRPTETTENTLRFWSYDMAETNWNNRKYTLRFWSYDMAHQHFPIVMLVILLIWLHWLFKWYELVKLLITEDVLMVCSLCIMVHITTKTSNLLWVILTRTARHYYCSPLNTIIKARHQIITSYCHKIYITMFPPLLLGWSSQVFWTFYPYSFPILHENLCESSCFIDSSLLMRGGPVWWEGSSRQQRTLDMKGTLSYSFILV